MKRTGIVMLFFCMVLLCACGQKIPQTDSKGDTQREELVIWAYYETQAQRSGLDTLIRDFNQSQNEYRASWEYVPMTGFNKGLSSAYTENELPDMAILDNPDMPALIQMGLFEDITQQARQWDLTEELYGPIVETLSFEGRYYGIPFNCNSTALIYNSGLLKEKGLELPDTWEELRETARILTEGSRSGFAMCAIEGEQGAFQILPWILAAEENPQNLGKEATEEAYIFLRSLLEDGSMSGNCINLTQTDLALEFVEGRAAIIQNGPWVFPMLDEAGIQYSVTSIPGRETENAVVGGENIGILKGKNVKGSLAFLRFCMEGDALTEFCEEASVLPAKISAAQRSAENNQKMEVYERQMRTAITRTSIPQWASVSRKLTDGFYCLVSHEATPKQIAEEIQNH